MTSCLQASRSHTRSRSSSSISSGFDDGSNASISYIMISKSNRIVLLLLWLLLNIVSCNPVVKEAAAAEENGDIFNFLDVGSQNCTKSDSCATIIRKLSSLPSSTTTRTRTTTPASTRKATSTTTTTTAPASTRKATSTTSTTVTTSFLTTTSTTTTTTTTNVRDEDDDRDDEEVACETEGESNILRNGLGDDSLFLWPDNKVPYVIGVGFNETNRENIEDSIENYNEIFDGCIRWVPKTDETVYVEFLNSGSCYSRVGRAYWPFPLPQSIFIGRCAHLIGHIKHEMMHTMGFYHEHSRSDRDMYIKVNWENIAEGRADQFQTYRWTTGFGEMYDYDSIMHYSSKAFSRAPEDDNIMTIEPVSTDRTSIEGLGRKRNLSDVDVVKIKKLYKCAPYENWDNGCESDNDCGINEHCAYSLNLIRGQCRTLLSDGSFCIRNEECLHQCSGGVCTSCTADSQCPQGQFCANKYVPFAENVCSNYCGELCLFSSTCGGSCGTCGWTFTCS